MKFKFLFAFLLGSIATVASAQGLKDAIEYFRANQPEEAEIIINRVAELSPAELSPAERSTACYYLGHIAFDRGNYDNANKLFNRGIELNAENAFNYVGLGMVALRDDAKAAENYFKQAKKLDKKNAVLLTDIARAYYKVDPVKYAKNIEKGIEEAKKADKACPAIYILQADMLADEDRPGDAAGYYEMAMNAANSSEYPEAFVKYARTYFSVNPQFAIKGLQNLLEISPNSALAQRELAEKYYENNQLTRAYEQYGKYIQNPNHFQRDEQRYVGLLYFGKNYNESNRWADIILANDPNNFYMKRMKFLNHAALENDNEAMAAAEEFFAAEGEFVPNDYMSYGELLHKLGNDSVSIIMYEKAVALAPERLNLYAELSSAYTNVGEFGKAAEAQQKFIDGGEYTTNDLMMLARRYQNAAATSEIGTPERAEYARRAVETINQVVEKAPNNYTVKLTRARILLIANDNQANEDVVAAMKELLDILDADPANKTAKVNDYIFILNQLGRYYQEVVQDTPQALVYYDKFVEINPDNEALVNYVKSLHEKAEQPVEE